VTYTGDGGANRAIPHNLGSTPGCFIVKRTDIGGTWAVWHRSLGDDYYLALESTQQAYPSSILVRSATSTTFSVGSDATVNASGGTYVCYLFAHNAGGFGLTGADNVISCGSFTADGSGNATVNLGYEPQWVMVKTSSTTSGWFMFDTMREISQTNSRWLLANTSAAEATGGGTPYLIPTATGFTANNSFFSASSTNIYIAIRRGPMKVPTTGTSVFSVTSGNFSTPYTVTTGFPVDLCYSSRTGGSPRHFNDRLRGPTVQTSYRYLATNTTDAESTGSGFGIGFQSNTSIIDNDWVTGANAVWWNFRRAPGFFDEV